MREPAPRPIAACSVRSFEISGGTRRVTVWPAPMPRIRKAPCAKSRKLMSLPSVSAACACALCSTSAPVVCTWSKKAKRRSARTPQRSSERASVSSRKSTNLRPLRSIKTHASKSVSPESRRILAAASLETPLTCRACSSAWFARRPWRRHRRRKRGERRSGAGAALPGAALLSLVLRREGGGCQGERHQGHLKRRGESDRGSEACDAEDEYGSSALCRYDEQDMHTTHIR
eukprot:2568529-Pleurochrysis_carterae.AAC.2